ncbi:MAG: glycosyltransferase [bacterium]|nr:glycosyltransferase [bacterium]
MPAEPERGIRSLLVTFDYPPTVGGIAHVLARFWRLAGHTNCVILAPDGPGAAAFDAAHPVRTIRFPAPSGRMFANPVGKTLAFFLGAIWTAFWVVRHRPQLVIAGQVVRAGPLAWCYQRLTGHPYDVWVYGGETRESFAGPSWFGRFLQRILRGARTLFTNSPYTTHEMLDFGLAADRVVELPLGVDRHVFQVRAPDPDLITRFGLRDRLVLLTVGRLIERKGVDRMFEALAGLGDRLPPWRYLVVSDGPHRAVLQRLAERLGLADRVVFCGFVEDAMLPAFYNTCDIFAMPNREVTDPEQGSLSVEGFGIVFLEAASCGKPVIAGRSGGAVHAVDDGVTGWLVDGDDVASIQTALLDLADAQRRQRMGDAGVHFAARFDWQESADILKRYL